MKRGNKILSVSGWIAFAVLTALWFGFHGQPVPVAASGGETQHQQSVAELTHLEGAFSHIAQQVRPSVVSVRVEKKLSVPAMQMTPFADPFFRRFFGAPDFSFPRPEDMRQAGAGSGVIVDPKGYILTNNHVVQDAEKITVVLSDEKHTQVKAKVVGTDPRTDLAVLKVEPPTTLTAATLGNSDQVQVGQWAIAIGNQLGEFDATLTVGVVSATGRRLNDLDEEVDYRDLIQTDAAINPGNSGGPLVNVQGEVIGINTAIASPNGGSVGIGFAIPINLAKRVMNQLIEHGKVERGYLGVMISNLDDTLKEFYHVQNGALVQGVEPESPAARAGLQMEDVIVRLNDQKVEDADALRTQVAALPPRTSVSLEVIRDGKPVSLTVKLGDFPSSAPERAQPSPASPDQEEHQQLGVAVTPLTEDVRQQLSAPPSVQGVVITDVVASSPAERAGLQPGDVIERIGRTPVRSLDDLRGALNHLGKQDSTVLKVWRHGEERIVPLSFKEE